MIRPWRPGERNCHCNRCPQARPPSCCHPKRALLFAEHVEEVLGQVPIRQYVVTIPKMLRLAFKYERKFLGELSRCFYESIKEIFLAAAPEAGCSPTGEQAHPAMIASIQTFGYVLSLIMFLVPFKKG